MGKASVYLDHNASSPLLPEVRSVMLQALDLQGNPSSVHRSGKLARKIIEDARREVGELVGASSENIVFTSGATEALNMLLTPHWLMGRAGLRHSRLYVLASDHPCVLAGGRFGNEDVTLMPVDSCGVADLAAMQAALDAHDDEDGLPLVALHAANNETGVIQPLEAIRSMVKAAGGTLIVDAVQAAGRLPVNMLDGYADFIALSAHKLGGPMGVGACIAASNLLMPKPFIRGGGQERGHRAGTENLPGIAGFGAAANAAGKAFLQIDDIRTLRDEFEASLKRIVPGIIIHGKKAERIANTSFFTLPGIKAETAQIALDLDGFSVSAGSACSSGKVGPSHVLTAMGADLQNGALRVSIGPQTSKADLDDLVEKIGALLARRKAA